MGKYGKHKNKTSLLLENCRIAWLDQRNGPCYNEKESIETKVNEKTGE